MRRALGIAAIVFGVVGAGYCVIGIIMTAAFTMSGTGVLIYLALFVVAMLVAIGGLLVLRRDSRRHGSALHRSLGAPR